MGEYIVRAIGTGAQRKTLLAASGGISVLAKSRSCGIPGGALVNNVGSVGPAQVRSTDGGENWQTVLGSLSDFVTSVTYDITSAQMYHLAIEGSSATRISADLGVSWSTLPAIQDIDEATGEVGEQDYSIQSTGAGSLVAFGYGYQDSKYKAFTLSMNTSVPVKQWVLTGQVDLTDINPATMTYHVFGHFGGGGILIHQPEFLKPRKVYSAVGSAAATDITSGIPSELEHTLSVSIGEGIILLGGYGGSPLKYHIAKSTDGVSFTLVKSFSIGTDLYPELSYDHGCRVAGTWYNRRFPRFNTDPTILTSVDDGATWHNNMSFSPAGYGHRWSHLISSRIDPR